MSESDRRSFLLGAPLAIFALDKLSQTALGQTSSAQTARQISVSQDVVEYWVRHMGVSPSALPGGEEAAARVLRGGTGDDAGLAREPLFFHVDNDDKVLIPAEEVDDKKLMESGDAKVDLKLARLRLNNDDKDVFSKYSSGGIYIDLQQSPRNTEAASAMASSFFSAIMPVLAEFKGSGKSSSKAAKGSSDSGKSSDKSSGKTSGKASAKASAKASKGDSEADNSPAPDRAPSSDGPPQTAASGGAVQLQQSQAQTISLPGGIGHAAFSCFAKDPHKSAFGQVVSAFLSISSNPLATFFPMLSIPALSVASLAPLRTLVANLQAHGENAWILQSGQLNLAATRQGASNLTPSLRMRSGNYIAVPKSQVLAMKGKLNGLKMTDGFLVPKEASAVEVYDAAPHVIPEITYLSLTSTVSKAKPGGCSASA